MPRSDPELELASNGFDFLSAHNLLLDDLSVLLQLVADFVPSVPLLPLVGPTQRDSSRIEHDANLPHRLLVLLTRRSDLYLAPLLSKVLIHDSLVAELGFPGSRKGEREVFREEPGTESRLDDAEVVVELCGQGFGGGDERVGDDEGQGGGGERERDGGREEGRDEFAA